VQERGDSSKDRHSVRSILHKAKFFQGERGRTVKRVSCIRDPRHLSRKGGGSSVVWGPGSIHSLANTAFHWEREDKGEGRRGKKNRDERLIGPRFSWLTKLGRSRSVIFTLRGSRGADTLPRKTIKKSKGLRREGGGLCRSPLANCDATRRAAGKKRISELGDLVPSWEYDGPHVRWKKKESGPSYRKKMRS